MNGKRVVVPLVGIGIGLFAGIAVRATGADEAQTKAPLVRVISPKDGAGYLVHAGEDTKLVVGVEITDVSGAGLETDDMGTPKFYEPDDNVDQFQDHIIAKGTYTNHSGQTVTQLFAEIPSRGLKIEKDMKLSPPIDVQSISEADMKKSFAPPMETMADVAMFHFRVRDRAGATSGSQGGDGGARGVADTDPARLMVGLAPDLYHFRPEDIVTDEDVKRAKKAAGAKPPHP